jgi:hypothetical protein
MRGPEVIDVTRLSSTRAAPSQPRSCGSPVSPMPMCGGRPLQRRPSRASWPSSTAVTWSHTTRRSTGRSWSTSRAKDASAAEWLDTLQLSLIAFPRLASHRLRDLAQAFGAHAPSHRATDDVKALTTVWRTVLCGLDEQGPALLGRLALLAPSSDWPARSVLSHILCRGSGDLVRPRRRAQAARGGRAGRGPSRCRRDRVLLSRVGGDRRRVLGGRHRRSHVPRLRAATGAGRDGPRGHRSILRTARTRRWRREPVSASRSRTWCPRPASRS